MFGRRLILCFAFVTRVVMAGGEAPMAVQHNYVLSRESPVITYRFNIKSQAVQKNKYVQVNISKVINPDLVPLSFKVYRQLNGNEQELLGTFSLFPPENPGRFIVATQGKVSNGDLILVVVEGIEKGKKSEDDIQVYIDSIKVD